VHLLPTEQGQPGRGAIPGRATRSFERTKLDSATLTGILDRLEAMGLVERRPNPADRRAILICLSKKGKKLASDVHRVIQKANRELLTGFGVQEERGLKAMLRRIHHG
jgi:DNA-binding MarR family transcriptional regulator